MADNTDVDKKQKNQTESFTAHGLCCYVILYEHDPDRWMGGGVGYVGIPSTHPLYGKNYEELAGLLDVHGGVTYTGQGSETNKLEDSKLYYIGWDARHHCGMEEMRQNRSYGIQVTLTFLKDETTKLAQQLAYVES